MHALIFYSRRKSKMKPAKSGHSLNTFVQSITKSAVLVKSHSCHFTETKRELL
jgi:hypothetical protein